jgi:hypothetical protein
MLLVTRMLLECILIMLMGFTVSLNGCGVLVGELSSLPCYLQCEVHQTWSSITWNRDLAMFFPGFDFYTKQMYAPCIAGMIDSSPMTFLPRWMNVS